MIMTGNMQAIIKEVADEVIGTNGRIVDTSIGDVAVHYNVRGVAVYEIEMMKQKGLFPYDIQADAQGMTIVFLFDGEATGYTPPKAKTGSRTFTGNNNTNVVLGDVLGDVVTNDKEIILRLLDTNAKLVRMIETLTQNK